MTSLHRLLQRQLRAVFGGPESGPPELQPLLARVDESYRQFEADYALLERSLELSSQELLQANAEMRVVLQVLPDVFMWLDSDGTILSCRTQDNGELLKPAEALVGRKIQRLPNAEARVAFQTALGCLAGGSSVETVDFSLTFGGEQRAYEARLLPLRPGQVLAVVRNISERKRIEAALIDAHEAALDAARLKSEFLDNMSHEIRTPMTSIIGMTELALGTDLTPEQRALLDVVQKSSEALLALLDDVLDFSKIDAGKLELEAIPFSLRECLEGALKTIALRAQRKGLEFICEIAPDAPDRLTGDPGRLRQVILNLVANAIKFTERGEIALRVAVDAEIQDLVTLRFSVQDTGIGIPVDKQQLIFRPFIQADGSATRRYGGAGLGLAICTQVVEMMGGEMGVESEPGKGSTFKFSISFRTEGSTKGPPVPAAEVSLRDKRVLVVDDNPTIRVIFTSVLDRCGAKALAVESGTAALDALESARKADTPFDLVLLDLHMSEMDGTTVAGLINQDPNLGTPIILLTSAGRPGDAARCRALGVAGYITKPITSVELIEAIRTVFNGPAAGGQRTIVTRHSLREERKRLRLLLAEGDLVNRSMIARMLEKRGHYVRAVEDGCEVLAALENESFDLILMDVQMPELDGFATTAAIRQRERRSGRHLPILAITAHALNGDRERCLQHGMDGYVSTPIHSRELFAAIEELVPDGEMAEVGPDDQHDPAVRIFDLEAALLNTEGDRAMLSQAVQACLNDCPRQLAAIHAALERGDVNELEHLTYQMKNGLEAVAAEAMARAAGRVEALAADGDLPASRLAVAALHRELDRLTPMLQSLLEAA